MSTEPTIPLSANPPLSSSDLLCRRTWTTQALNAGGVLTVKQILPGKAILVARMDWPGETPMQGLIALSIEGALDNLEDRLADDCAEEMFKNGSA